MGSLAFMVRRSHRGTLRELGVLYKHLIFDLCHKYFPFGSGVVDSAVRFILGVRFFFVFLRGVMNRLIAIFAVVLLAFGVRAQDVVGDTTVSLVTMYPGSHIYELEGHTAIRITMPDGDWAVSYGTFDFEQPNFVYRFVKGETDYWVTLWLWAPFEAAYREAGRRIVEQRINMDSSQKQALLNVVAENLLPENRTYRYNYVKDNCATRPLRVIERALGDSIVLGPVPEEFAPFKSWREVMTYCHRNYPWYQFGIDLALGSGIDGENTNREMAFAPIILCEQLRTATSAGRKVVDSETVLNDVPAQNAVDSPTPWFATPMAVMCAFMALTIALCALMFRRHRLIGWIYAVCYGLLGLAGCLLAFLIFVSVHEATSPNMLFLVINPLCFIGVAAAFKKKTNLFIKWWFVINVIALLVATAIFLTVLPLNGAMWPLFIADMALSATYLFITCKTKN